MVYFADALRHNRIVHKFEENICACALCDFTVFQHYSDLRAHVEAVHVDEFRPFTCTLCDFGGNTKSALVKHFQLAHPQGGEDSYPCDFCSTSFATVEAKQRHEIESHPLEITGYCQQCHKKFESKEGLVKHIMLHHSDTGYLGFQEACGKKSLSLVGEDERENGVTNSELVLKPGMATNSVFSAHFLGKTSLICLTGERQINDPS